MENLITTQNLTKEKILKIFEKADQYRGKETNKLNNKTLGMLFEKSSTRTRISFQEAMYQLGGRTIFLSKTDTQLGRGEPIKDTARVLSRYIDGTMARLHEHEKILKMKEHSNTPVINGLTDKLHPCQSLTDYYTIWRKKDLNAKVVFLGDGSNNVCHSLINTSNSLETEITVSCPVEHEPKTKEQYNLEHNPEKAVEDADVIYTDVWKSMGEKDKDTSVFKPYQVNKHLLNISNKDSMFMHCLPAHRDKEVTDEVIEGDKSIVFDQAENRLHLQKALLLELLE